MYIRIFDFYRQKTVVQIKCTPEEWQSLPSITVNDKFCVVQFYTDDCKLFDTQTGEIFNKDNKSIKI